MVGEYVFYPRSTEPGRFADFIILKNDNTTVEVRFSKDTGEARITKGKWGMLTHAGGTYHVGIDDFSHPVEGTLPSLKLGIDGDLGAYYEKVR